MVMTRRKSAGVCEIKHFSNLTASQRLNAENLIYAYLVGLIEGNGYFSISYPYFSKEPAQPSPKIANDLKYELGMEFSIKDVQLVYKIKSLLGVGNVLFLPRNEREMVLFRIKNKDHLKNIILPIFDKYPMLSSKQYDYLRFKHFLLADLTFDSHLPKYIKESQMIMKWQDIIKESQMINKCQDIIKLPYFSSWLVGFIEAKACFSISNQIKKGRQGELKYETASFDISQSNDEIIIPAIGNYLSFTKHYLIDQNNISSLKVSGTRSIENLIKFLQKAPVKLMGYKKLQYLL